MMKIAPAVFLMLISALCDHTLLAQNSDDSVSLKQPVQETEIREYLDLQMHPTMHVPYSFFGKGFTSFSEEKEPNLSYKHLLKNVNYANYWKDNAGARIIISGALNKENVRNPKKARANILRQINYVNDFAAENSDDFVVAKSPQEARNFILTTKKTVILHSIEGAKKLVNSQEDADFWADQGVSFITLVHLRDNELGSSAIMPQFGTKLINLNGLLKSSKKRDGLTELGKETILWLACSGIMTDITHMSDKCRTEALNFMEEHDIPPISTHDLYRPIQNHPRGISKDQILQIYRNKGFVSLPISGESLSPYKPSNIIQNKLDSMPCYCDGSVDSYQFTYEELKAHIESNYQTISGDSLRNFSDLSESEKVSYSIGFQSDFNGWLNHSRPKVGKKGCYDLEEGKSYEKIETDGMPHPGYLESQWNYLEKKGVDLQPIERNSERFIQLWETFLERKCD